MTDTAAQDQNAQTPAAHPGQRTVAPPVARSQQQTGRQIQTPSSVSGNRELAPMSVATDEDEPTIGSSAAPPPAQVETAKPREISVSKELQEAGVETGKDAKEIKIEVEVQNAGVAPAKESVPMSQIPTPSIKLPMSEEEALRTMKKSKITEAVKWIAAEVAYQWKKYTSQLDSQEYK